MEKGIDQWWLNSAEDLIGSAVMKELQLLPGHVLKGMVLLALKFFRSFIRNKIQVLFVNKYRILWTSGLTVEPRGTPFCPKGSKLTSIWKE